MPDGASPPSGGSTGGALDAAPPPRDARPDSPSSSSDANAHDIVAEILARLQPDSVEAQYRELESMSRPDRSAKSANFLRITEWVRDTLMAEAPAATVRFDEQNGYRNVEITIKGSDPSAGMYAIGGHLDSVKNTVAMDDNGSGSLGAAIVARALAHYRFKSEIRAILFDAEELGLVGSSLYAKALKASGCAPSSCLKAFVNMDMLGFDPQDQKGVQVMTDMMDMRALHAEVNARHSLGLSLVEVAGACHRSDDCSFADEGYPVVYDKEANVTPYIHKPSDTADTLNYATLTKSLQLIAGVVATSATPTGRVP